MSSALARLSSAVPGELIQAIEGLSNTVLILVLPPNDVSQISELHFSILKHSGKSTSPPNSLG